MSRYYTIDAIKCNFVAQCELKVDLAKIWGNYSTKDRKFFERRMSRKGFGPN